MTEDSNVNLDLVFSALTKMILGLLTSELINVCKNIFEEDGETWIIPSHTTFLRGTWIC